MGEIPPDRRIARHQTASIYQVMADSKNNLWMAEFTEGHLGKIDAKTTKVTWYPIPTAHARARRMQIDNEDRVLVTEYRDQQGRALRHQDGKVHRIHLAGTHVPLSGQFRQER